MSVIIGGRQSILMQIPKELRQMHPRLSKTLSSEECQEILSQSLSILEDESMSGSHNLFCDIVRLVLALQLSVAEANFEPEKTAKPDNSLNLILPE